MRRKRIVQADKCYHLVSRVAHKAFFFDDEEKQGYIAQTLPQKPKSPLQRYRILRKGREVLA